MESTYKVVNVPLERGDENLRKVAKLEVISNQKSGSGLRTLREVTNLLVKYTGRVYAAKLKDEVIGYITYKKGDALRMGSYFIADKFKGNGVGCALRARAIKDATK
jgi:predicted GNAT family acetyltransferase